MAANKFPSSVLLWACSFLIFVSLFNSSYAHQDCTSHPFYTKNIYTNCATLPSVNTFLHWNYHPSNHTVDIAYRESKAPFRLRWIAWCLNPSEGGLIGSECLVAADFHEDEDGVYVYTSIATRESYGTRSYLINNDLLKSFRGELIGKEIIIYATLLLPNGNTTFTHVGQYGNTWHYWLSEPYSTYIATIDFATSAPAPSPDTAATAPTPTTDVATTPTPTTDTVTAPAPTTDAATAPITDTRLLGSIKSQNNVGHYNVWKKAAYTGVLVISLGSIATLLAFGCYLIVLKSTKQHQQKQDNGGSSCCV